MANGGERWQIYALNGLVAVLTLTACQADLTLPPQAAIACSAISPCPDRWRCHDDLQVCIREDSDDASAPQVVTATVLPPILGPGGSSLVTFVLDEEVGLAPVVHVDPAGLDRAADFQGKAELTFAFRYTAQGDEPPGPLDIEALLLDRTGNRAARTIGSLGFDYSGPAVLNLAWVGAPPSAGSTDVLSVAATTEETAILDGIDLIDQADNVIGQLESSTTVVAGGPNPVRQITGRVDLGLIGPDPMSVSALRARLRLRDPFGNPTPVAEATTTAVPLDATPPVTQFTLDPGPTSTDREPRFEFSSPGELGATYECQVDNDPFQPCTSPFEPIIATTGNHTVRVRATDLVGNVEEVPAQHDWSISRGWSSLAVGFDACAIASDRTLWCWGDEPVGSRSPYIETLPLEPSSLMGWEEVAVVGDTACALRDFGGAREVWCWGDGPLGDGTPEDRTYPQLRKIPDDDWRTVSVSTNRCAIKLDGSLWCWGPVGNRGAGQVTSNPVLLPTQVSSATDWVAAAPGMRHGCGIRQAGTARTMWCWGDDTNGALGTGGGVLEPEPVQVGMADDWLAVGSGSLYTCGLRGGSTGTLWCWGNIPGSTSSNTPVQVGMAADWVSLSADRSSACVIKADGSAWCWGAAFPHLAPPSQIDEPELVDTRTDWSALTHDGPACGLRGQNELWCWGANRYGELGVGYTNEAQPPLPAVGPAGWSSVSLADGGCGTDSNGSLWCWGAQSATCGVPSGYEGQPVIRDSNPDWQAQVGVGWADYAQTPDDTHGCGIRGTGPSATVMCWGMDNHGQLGDGATTHPTGTCPPVQAGPAAGWIQVAVGFNKHNDDYSLGLRADGTLWEWGQPADTVIDAPTQVVGTDWLHISASRSTCGVRDGGGQGQLWCWGRTFWTEHGLTGDSDIPVQIGVGLAYETGWRSVSVGRGSSCGIRENASDRTVWCWGLIAATVGPALTPEHEPRQVGADVDWRSVAVGDEHACAIKNDGSLWCVGSNARGQIGPVDSVASTPSWVRSGAASDWDWVVARAGGTCAGHTSGATECWGYNPSNELPTDHDRLPVQVMPP